MNLIKNTVKFSLLISSRYDNHESLFGFIFYVARKFLLFCQHVDRYGVADDRHYNAIAFHQFTFKI